MNSWTLLRIRGIPLKIHVTLLIAVPYFAFVIAAQLPQMANLAGFDPNELTMPAVAWGIILALGLFASVAVHELAHTLVALRKGRKVHSITLMLLGGISHIEGEHADKPHEREGKSGEAGIAAVGPLVSLVTAFLFYVAHVYSYRWPDLSFGLFYLSQLNLTIAVFNMVPAYPLDGGRVLRAILSHRMGPERATAAAVAVSKGFALAFAIFGVLSANLVLLLIALFVYSAGVYELRMMHIKKRLEGVTAGDLSHKPLARLSAAVSVELALHDLVARRQETAAVVSGDGRFVGTINLRELGRVPEERRQAVPIGLVTNDEVARLEARAPAITAVEAIATHGPVAAVVSSEGMLEGFIDADDVRRVLEIKDIDDSSRRAA